MLTDIFSIRYEGRQVWPEDRAADTALRIQMFRMINEQLFPNGDPKRGEAWASVQSKLSLELGLESLGPLFWQAADGWKPFSMDVVCRQWMLSARTAHFTADAYMKQRVSLVELAFRERLQHVREATARCEMVRTQLRANQTKPASGSKTVMDTLLGSQLITAEAELNRLAPVYQATCDELNERLHRAKLPLSYHNGFIQVETDALTEEEIAKPFWALVSDPKWANVAVDMLDAIDKRDRAERDAAFNATRALESVLKIISAEKGWSTGTERGASNYIDNLRSSRSGAFIVDWEADALKLVFSKIRNELGHGPGPKPMPSLTQQQTGWVIENAMSWTKSLIARM